MTNLPVGQITPLSTDSPRPRSMAFRTLLPQLQQENANLRELLNKSMAENVELLQQVTEQQAALNVENEKLARMIDSSAQSRLANMTEAYQEAKKRVDGLTAALDLMNERQRLEWARAENAEDKADKMRRALVDIGDTLFKNYVLRLAVRDVAPSMEELTKACQLLNRALGVQNWQHVALNDAPTNVSVEADPFSAEVDGNS